MNPIMKEFINQENSLISSDISSTMSIQTLLVVIFVFLLILAFLIFWLPKISSMNTEVKKHLFFINLCFAFSLDFL